ncbi:MAG: hypothetical protein QM817_22720 [Archangium sp.]
MSNCVSCGLKLPSRVEECPGCGQRQALDAASSETARCSVHTEVVATGTCGRCGRFMCVACTDADAQPPSCRSCSAPLASELETKLARLFARMGVGSVIQALLVPALAFAVHEENLTVICLFVAVPAFGLGLLTAVSGKLWILAPIAAGLLGLLALWSLSAGWLMVLGVPVALLMVKWFFESGPLEKELWRLKHYR